MLSSILPGLRDVRTPLTAGALWLAAIWITFSEPLSRTPRPGGFWGRTLELLETDRAMAASVAIFIALLLGATLLPFRNPPRPLTRLVYLPDLRHTLALPYRDVGHPYREWLADRGESIQETLNPRGAGWDSRRTSLERLIDSALETAYSKGWTSPAIAEHLAIWDRWELNDICEQHSVPGVTTDGGAYGEDITRGRLSNAIAVAVRGDSELLATRLQHESPAKHDEYERLSAEGSYRIGVFVPLFVLLVCLAIRMNEPFILAALAIPFVFATQGMKRYYESRSIIDLAVEQGLIRSDILNAVQEFAEASPIELKETDWAISRLAEHSNEATDMDRVDSETDQDLEDRWIQEALMRSYDDGSGWSIKVWPLVLAGTLVGLGSGYGATQVDSRWQIVLIFFAAFLLAWLCAIPLLSALPGRWPRRMYEQWDLRRWSMANLPATGSAGTTIGLAIGVSHGGTLDPQSLLIGGLSGAVLVTLIVRWIGRTER